MSERERWIVYPLLFLALGAALRDKIIKTTKSQRIECEALCVFDSKNQQPLLLLGAEQFPDLRPLLPDMIAVDRVHAKSMQSELVQSKALRSDLVVSKEMQTEVAAATEYIVLKDGAPVLHLNASNGMGIVQVLKWLGDYYNRVQAVKRAGQAGAATSPRRDRPAPPEPPSTSLGTPNAVPPASATPEITPPAPQATQPAANEPAEE